MLVDTIFKALADPTRLRTMRLLSAMELAVGELAQVLGQSQPRVSRHVGILCDAGLAERRREGSWVFLREASGEGRSPEILHAVADLLALAENQDAEFAAICEADRCKLAAIRDARDLQAEEYFARHASQWDELRELHSPDAQVEEALVEALDQGSPGSSHVGAMLDIGTGTGRMAELFADKAVRITALDKNLEMLRVARAKLQHVPSAQIELVQGDFADLPVASGAFDTALLHQVLHFAQEPSIALAEAARALKPHGRIAIVDFASHDREELRGRHAHARLGFSDQQMAKLLDAAGFAPGDPIALDGGELTVKIWIGKRRGDPASSQQRHAAKAPTV